MSFLKLLRAITFITLIEFQNRNSLIFRLCTHRFLSHETNLFIKYHVLESGVTLKLARVTRLLGRKINGNLEYIKG